MVICSDIKPRGIFMGIEITRHFVSISNGRWGARQVHYRKTGSGPVVICFHQSPLSSRDMLATMERWKNDFTCIAPDSPGFGLSDPLGVAQAEIGDFAEAAIEFMDALGIERAAVYGFHTGAMISAAIAAAYPQRIVCAAANGYVILTEPERKDILDNYLPAIEPKWDGSHLTWLWARMREQVIFFPWYRQALADRLSYDVPPPEAIHNSLLDFLRSGDNYRVGYRAAFTMRSDLALRCTATPILITAAKTDVLAKHLGNVRHPSACVTVQAGGMPEETLDLCRDFIKRHELPKAPSLAGCAAVRGVLRQDYIDLPAGQIRVRRNDDVTGRPVVIIHDATGSSEIVSAVARGFIGHRPVLAINLPGHGESDNVLSNGEVTVDSYANAVDRVLDVAGLGSVDIVGLAGGGVIGLAVAQLPSARVKQLVMIDVPYFDDALRRDLLENGAPEIKPTWFGGHLLEAWYVMRDHGLFWPWYRRNRSGIIWQEPQIDPQMVQARVLELFRSNGMWREAHRAYLASPLAPTLRRGGCHVLFAAATWSPHLETAKQAAKDFPDMPFVELPRESIDWAHTLLPKLV